MDQHSAKRISIARIFAACGSIGDTITACGEAHKATQDALQILELIEDVLGSETAAPGDLRSRVARAKAHLQRSTSALERASTSAHAVADAMRFDAA